MQPLARKTKMAHLGASIYQPDEDYGCTTYPRAVLLEAPLVASPVRQRALQFELGSLQIEGPPIQSLVQLWIVFAKYNQLTWKLSHSSA
jgi:hypothetical protein